MANEFLTVQEIANESLARLRNNLVMGGLVYRNYDNEFGQKGDTIQVRKPATFEAKDFTTATENQDIVEDKVLVTLDKIADVTVEVSSRQLTQNIQDFGAQVVEGAMQAISQKIDTSIMGLYADIPFYTGTPGQDPSTLSHLSNARKVLNVNKAPMNLRRLVLDPDAEAKLLVLDAVVNAEKSGSTQALREASLGRLMGFDTFMSQNVKQHLSGNLDAGVDLDLLTNAAVVKGANTLVIKAETGGTLTGTAKVGDIFSVEDAAGTYTVTKVNDLATTQTVEFYPVAPEGGFAINKAVTFIGSHTANLGFHRDAFALVNRPMALPMGGANGAIANYEGLSIRVTQGYTMGSKVNTISFDILYGVKTMRPELAVRTFGTSI